MKGYAPAVSVSRARGKKLTELCDRVELLERLLLDALAHLKQNELESEVIERIDKYFAKKNQSKIAQSD